MVKLWMFKGPALSLLLLVVTWPIHSYIFQFSFWESIAVYIGALALSVPMYAPVQPVPGSQDNPLP